MVAKVKELLERNKLINKLINNYSFRTIVFSSFSFLFDIVYAIFNMVLAGLSHSLWCGALACFYLFLVFLRGYLIIDEYKIEKTKFKDQKERINHEIKKYRLCGIIFIFLTLCLSAMITLIVKEEKIFEYSLSVIYIISGYTLYRIGIAIFNYIKVNRYDNYIVKSLRCINLVTAFTSFLSLQSIALKTFSNHLDIHFANALTGVVVCLLIVLIGVFMIVSSKKRKI